MMAAKKLRIVGYFHLFCPEHNAGSEVTVYAALRALVRRGHDVKVVCDRSITAPYNIDGIQVVRPPRRGQQSWLENFVKDADILVTHLDLTSQAMQLALIVKKPLVHFIHNDAQLLYWRVNTLKAQLIVFNSNWIAEKPEHWHWLANPNEKTLWPGHSIVLHPVVEKEHYICERGEGITLVNPTPGKGVEAFKALARLMPDRQFLAVEGGYGEQVIQQDRGHARAQRDRIDNVELMAHTPDIRNVFRRTKVLLMPSEYESYGRVGIEAACAGIPTICHPTPGLKEAFGDAAIFLDRNDIPAWFNELSRLLTDDVYYRKRSDMAIQLTETFEPEKEFDRLEAAFIETVDRWDGGQEDGKVNIWISDRWIWRLADGNYKASDDQRIPVDAVSLFAGKGTEVSRDLAVRNGWVADGKAISGPAENKAIQSPEQTKKKSKVA